MEIRNTANQKLMRKFMVYALIFVFIFNFSAIHPAFAEDTGGDASIDTGNANVGAAVENDVNQNTTIVAPPEPAETIISDSGEGAEVNSTESGPSSGEENIDPDTSAPFSEPSGENLVSDGGGTEGDTTTVDNTNEGEVGNSVSGSGETGANGIGTEETGTSTGDSTITTGDANIGSGIDNDVNGNTTVVECVDCEGGETSSTNVDNTNTASTSNGVALDGNTGDNEIDNTGGDATITTGDIGIINVIINFINHNIFGQGSQFFINIWNSVVQSIDLSGYNEDGEPVGEEVGACEVNDCLISINNTNTGEITNDILINADTGTNEIANTLGESIIDTGDINIANDVLNIANLNITGNDWFFAVVNIFGELEGDIILPSAYEEEGEAEARTERLSERLERVGERTSEVIITNTNNANVLNNIDINANTGENEIATSADALITTGDADVKSNTFNLINYNIFGDTWKFARVNLFGSWQGFIQGLPEGYSYMEDGFGVTIYSDILDDPAMNAQFAMLLVDNTNTATTTNNITINANTGENAILHGAGGASINTGNINIYNSLLNFINSNFTGNNWEFSMINVFGDWQGNLAFGQPELWVTEAVNSPSPARSGDYVTYKFLFGNNGDALATNVRLIDNINNALVGVFDASGASGNGGSLFWNLGNIPPNSQGSLSYTVRVNDDIPRGDSEAFNTVTIASDENDRDPSNNSAGGRVLVRGASGSGGSDFSTAGNNNYGNSLPGLIVIKSNDAEGTVGPGDHVNFKIVIKNPTNIPLEEVLALDIMSGIEDEVEINRNFWDLGTVYDGEEIIIDYTVKINYGIKSGTYINEVTVEGYDPVREGYISVVASSKIKVNNPDYRPGGNAPQLVISKVMKSEFANPGDIIDYKLIIANNGHIIAEDVVVSEDLPYGLSFSHEGGRTSKKWDLGNMRPGDIEDIDILVDVDNNIGEGSYEMTSTVSAANHDKVEIITTLDIRTTKVLGESNEQTVFSDNYTSGNIIRAFAETGVVGGEEIIGLSGIPILDEPVVEDLTPRVKSALAASEDSGGSPTQSLIGMNRWTLIFGVLILWSLFLYGLYYFRRHPDELE